MNGTLEMTASGLGAPSDCPRNLIKTQKVYALQPINLKPLLMLMRVLRNYTHDKDE